MNDEPCDAVASILSIAPGQETTQLISRHTLDAEFSYNDFARRYFSKNEGIGDVWTCFTVQYSAAILDVNLLLQTLMKSKMSPSAVGCFRGAVFGLTGELPRKMLEPMLKSNGAMVTMFCSQLFY